MHLASKALAKKSTNKGRNCKGKTLIETPAEVEDTLPQVTDTRVQNREKMLGTIEPNKIVWCFKGRGDSWNSRSRHDMRETVTLCGHTWELQRRGGAALCCTSAFVC